MSQFTHAPVMLAECLAYLRPEAGMSMLDATVGLGGHAEAILRTIGPTGRIVCVDRDPEALARSERRLREVLFEQRWPQQCVEMVHTPFGEFWQLATDARFDGILLDLGVSSMQLDDGTRGFSFRSDAPLDMRMDPTDGESAAELISRVSETELARILWQYGEERHSRRIARWIVERRDSDPVLTTQQLADLIRRAYPPAQRHGATHPATQSFQAIRIAVNGELDALERFLGGAPDHLTPGGRIAVLSYHSLEDRIVKRRFVSGEGLCVCPPNFPACGCGAVRKVRVLTRKPVMPAPGEIESNPRARSARLRVAEGACYNPARVEAPTV